MRAIVQERYGPADVLELKDVDQPEIGDDEVLVRVEAVAVGPGVWHLMTGLPYAVRLGFGLRRPKDRIAGSDLAGTVEATGQKVTRFRPGDHVFGEGKGALAEYAVAPEGRLAAKPAESDWAQAAALVSGCTALQALRDQGNLEAGQHVLVIGAGGGVGSLAVQIARALEAEVTGVCSTSKVELVRSIGANHVIDYTREDFADGGQRYDLIVDTAGNRPLSQLRRALREKGTVVIVGGEGGGRWLGGMTRMMGAMATSAFVSHKLRSLISSVKAEDLELLAQLASEGKVAPVIDRIYGLAETADAIRYWEEGHASGKIVVTV